MKTIYIRQSSALFMMLLALLGCDGTNDPAPVTCKLSSTKIETNEFNPDFLLKFEYDAAGRIIKQIVESDEPDNNNIFSYTYDADGRINVIKLKIYDKDVTCKLVYTKSKITTEWFLSGNPDGEVGNEIYYLNEDGTIKAKAIDRPWDSGVRDSTVYFYDARKNPIKIKKFQDGEFDEEYEYVFGDAPNPMAGVPPYSTYFGLLSPVYQAPNVMLKYREVGDTEWETIVTYTLNKEGYPVSAKDTFDPGGGDESDTLFQWTYENCK